MLTSQCFLGEIFIRGQASITYNGKVIFILNRKSFKHNMTGSKTPKAHAENLCLMCSYLAIKNTAKYKYHVQLFWMEGHPGPTKTYTSDPGLSGPGEHDDS